MTLLIRNGRIVTAADDYTADIYVENGQVARIGALSGMPADRVIDATGNFILPGMVDPHTHMETRSMGTITVDDFTNGTRAAAAGGTTSILHFAFQDPGQGIGATVDSRHAALDAHKPIVDVGFHLAVTDLSVPNSLEELAALPEKGVTSYKLFMAYKGALMVDDSTLFQVMQVAGQTGSMTMVHAENGDVIDVLVRQALSEGKTEPGWHAATRPPETEGEAVDRAIQLARIADAPLYVVHVSCREGLEPIERARDRGWSVWGETCPQYLVLDDSVYDAPGFEGVKYVFTPPPRAVANQDATSGGR